MVYAHRRRGLTYRTKSVKAAGILSAEHRGLIERAKSKDVKLKFLIFGPKKKSDDYYNYRLPLRDMIRDSMDGVVVADFPEDIECTLEDDSATRELFMIYEYDYTIILLMSPGPISEYSFYVTDRKCAEKIRLYIPRKYLNRPNYIIKGPVKIFKDRFGHVYYFKKADDLLKHVHDMITSHIIYAMHSH